MEFYLTLLWLIYSERVIS